MNTLVNFSKVGALGCLLYLRINEGNRVVTEAFETESFTERTFGDQAGSVSAAFVAAGLKAHDWASAAQHSSGRATGQPYGSTFWLALPDEVGLHLRDLLEDAVLYPPHGAQYKLILWGDTLILPVKVIQGRKRDGRLRIRTSHLRQSLTSVNMPDGPEVTLFMTDEEAALQEFEEQAIEAVENARQQLGNIVSNVIIAAYDCTRVAGLKLSLIAPIAGAKPVEVAGESWHDSPKPKTNLEPIDGDRRAAGEDAPDDGPDRPDKSSTK
jgi:hypothetical protein